MPSDKSASLVRRLLSGAFIFACTSALAREPSLLTSISGLWQFAELNVWIQIDEKGAAYQCRIGMRELVAEPVNKVLLLQDSAAITSMS